MGRQAVQGSPASRQEETLHAPDPCSIGRCLPTHAIARARLPPLPPKVLASCCPACRRTQRWEGHIWSDKKQVYLGEPVRGLGGLAGRYTSTGRVKDEKPAIPIDSALWGSLWEAKASLGSAHPFAAARASGASLARPTLLVLMRYCLCLPSKERALLLPGRFSPSRGPRLTGAYDVLEQAGCAHDVMALKTRPSARPEDLNFPAASYAELLPFLQQMAPVPPGRAGGRAMAGQKRGLCTVLKDEYCVVALAGWQLWIARRAAGYRPDMQEQGSC